MANQGQAASYYQMQDQTYEQQAKMNYNQQPEYDQNQKYTQAPPSYGQNNGNGNMAQQEMGGKQSFDDAFKVTKPKYNDIWAAVLFLLVFAGFTAISGISLQGYSAFKGLQGNGIYNNPNNFGLNTNTVVLFAFVVGMAAILGWSYVLLARTFPKVFIWVTGILNIIFGFVSAIYMLVNHYYSGGIVFLIFSILTVFFFISWIPRIPFSALMLQTSIDVSKHYGHVYLTSLLGGIVAAAFGAWYSVTLVGIYAKYEPNGGIGSNPACANGGGGCSSGKVIGLIVCITFAMYWISEVINNVIHVTISGVYGSWYFCPNNLPHGPTRGAFKRAMTNSFGSICFGSLIVAIINSLRQLCSVAQQQSGGGVGQACFCILGCLIGILDWAVQFFNRYAFSHIALYGKAYVPAAKDTWQLVKRKGIDALINECLLGPVLTMGATFVGYACALLAYLYLRFTDPVYNQGGTFTPVVVAFAFVVGLQITHIFTTPISSGIDTIFVAMAWDPQVMMNEHPELWQKMIKVYPNAQDALEARH